MADGTTTTIRAPRQMGKTSLLVRGVQDARKMGQQVVYIDLQRVNETYLSSLDGLLRYIADEITQRLNLMRPSSIACGPARAARRTNSVTSWSGRFCPRRKR
jgi:predicted AAA+ superfamily ATPase